jgi:hypothetical protein
MDIETALLAAKCREDFTLLDLCEAQRVLEAAGHDSEAITIEEYLIDQSDEAWEAAGIQVY